MKKLFPRLAGLQDVNELPDGLLMERPSGVSGVTVACAMEGTRPLLLEIQALLCHSNFGIPRRQATGTVRGMSVSFKVQHRIHHMLQHPGTRYRTLLRHMSHDQNGDAQPLCQLQKKRARISTG